MSYLSRRMREEREWNAPRPQKLPTELDTGHFRRTMRETMAAMRFVDEVRDRVLTHQGELYEFSFRGRGA